MFRCFFLRNCQSVFESGYTILHSHQQQWEFLLSHILASIWLSQCSGVGLSNRCKVLSPCFKFCFPNDIRCKTFFMRKFFLSFYKIWNFIHNTHVLIYLLMNATNIYEALIVCQILGKALGIGDKEANMFLPLTELTV